MSLSLRLLKPTDIPEIAAAFQQLGWDKSASQYERYLNEQTRKLRDVHVAFTDEQFAGYLTICWTSTYPPFREANIPEIVDLNVLPQFRRRHLGTALMDRAESEIAKVSASSGIGVGLTPDYGAAQRMYILRGYLPDGRGLYYRGHHIQHSETLTADDNLVLYLTKESK